MIVGCHGLSEEIYKAGRAGFVLSLVVDLVLEGLYGQVGSLLVSKSYSERTWKMVQSKLVHSCMQWIHKSLYTTRDT